MELIANRVFLTTPAVLPGSSTLTYPRCPSDEPVNVDGICVSNVNLGGQAGTFYLNMVPYINRGAISSNKFNQLNNLVSNSTTLRAPFALS